MLKNKPPLPVLNACHKPENILSSQSILIKSTIFNARMAELVDALVSNTSVRKDMPVRSRLRVLLKDG